VEGTAGRRGHVRGAQTLRQERGQQVREEVQAVRRVTGREADEAGAMSRKTTTRAHRARRAPAN